MNYKRLIISLALPQMAGIIGSFFTAPAISTWYATLQKPSFNPPNWLFAPVWTAIYILMGISLYLVWQKIDKDKRTKTELWIFWIHLFFNAIWSLVFFGLQNLGLAFFNLLIIWIMIIILMIRFWKFNRWATYLLIPYLLWVSFAGFLNGFLWYLN